MLKFKHLFETTVSTDYDWIKIFLKIKLNHAI